MALTDSFPGPSGLTDSIETGKDLAALVAHVGGVPRAGITWGTTPLVASRSDLRVDVAPFKAVLVRNGAVRLLANDATAQSPEFTVPTANSRIDVLYVKVGETSESDATDGPFFGIVVGTAAAIPAKPVLSIAGALELASVLIPSTATGTNSAGVTITQSAPRAAAAGVNPDLFVPLQAAGVAAGVTVVAGGVTTTAISFPVGRFTVPPIVNATITADYRDISAAVTDVTTSGFNLRRGSTATGSRAGVTAVWHAVQMTATTAAG